MLGAYGGYSGYGNYGFGGNPVGYGYPPETSTSSSGTATSGSTTSSVATSGTTSSPNSLSMNLGGVNVNYNLGPSVSTLAAQSAQFLNNSFSNDAAFLGQTIVGANSLVTNLTQPLINAAQTEATFNNSQLPGFYNTLAGENYTLGQSAIAAETQTANASIAASRSAASSAGGCYITSAVCEVCGLPDDCYTLKTLREFRDRFLLTTNVGRAFVQEYYDTAPKLAEKIRARTDAKDYLTSLYTRFILPALLSIEWKLDSNAFKIYRRMIYTIRSENPINGEPINGGPLNG